MTVNVREIFDASDGTYGHRRVHAQLGRDNVAAGPELVRRVMVEGNMGSCQPRPYRNTTDPDGSAGADDLVGRDFTARAPGVKFVGDITYIRTRQGWGVSGDGDRLLLQMVVGFAMADHMRTGLVTDVTVAIDAGGSPTTPSSTRPRLAIHPRRFQSVP
ncbi:MAG: IS3 family transposase [Candidatus Microthrix sp.]|nr:IS3 family transposase [Candidatus Microthrix sp.]MBK6440353.1 IS3 family transposase [Candidatus Microthrix sp.]